MALPEDVTTCTLTFGPYLDASGEPVFAGVTGKVKPSVPQIRHAASGAVVIDSPIPVVINAFGVAEVELAHTDQATLSPVGFTYTVVWDVASRKPSPGNRQIALPQAVGATVDFDLLAASEDVEGVLVPIGATGPQGPQGAPGVADDASVAALVTGSGATSVALKAASVAAVTASGTVDATDVTRHAFLPGSGHGAGLTGRPGFFVKGGNIGPGPGNITSSAAMWTTAWDWAGWFVPNLDRAQKLGLNTLRILGSHAAYTANPAQYKSRFNQFVEACRSRNMKVIYPFLNGVADDTISTSLDASYKTMIADLMAPYVGDQVIFGWDVANELDPLNNSTHLSVIQSLAPYIKSVDPGCLVTSSGISSTTSLNGGHNRVVDPYVDYHSVHFYAEPHQPGTFAADWFDSIRQQITKPFLVDEVGANSNTSGGPPVVSDPYAQAAYMRAVRQYAADGDCMGFMAWKITDSLSGNKFGLYDSNGNPTPQLTEFMGYPSVRLDAARDAVNYRHTPMVADDFRRADSATSVGTSPIGGAPTAGAGTWGIQSKRLYCPTRVAVQNPLVWETNHSEPTVECEFIPHASGAAVELIFRYQDVNNYCYLIYQSAAGGTLTLGKVVAGTRTAVLLDPAGPPEGGVNSVPFVFPTYGRMGVRPRGQFIQVYAWDRLVGTSNSAITEFEFATKAGVGVRQTSDAGTVFTRFSAQMRMRRF